MAYLKIVDSFYQFINRFTRLLKWSSDGEDIDEEVETTVEGLAVSEILVPECTLSNGKEDSKLIETCCLEVN